MSAKLTFGLLLAWCLFAVGCDKKSQDNSIASDSPIPVETPSNEFCNEFCKCSDGTVYVYTANVKTKRGKLTWLVAGKAVIVNLDDLEYKTTSLYGTDSLGGLYLSGKSHLWYVNAGIPRVVTTVPVASVKPEDHRVTSQTILWQQFPTTRSSRENGESNGEDGE